MATPSAPLVIVPGIVTTVTLNRPEVRNAFNDEMIGALRSWAESVRPDGDVRVVVLRGAGTVFSAGADLHWMGRMVDFTLEENVADARGAARMFEALDTLPVPVIGRVQGAAIGGGAGLAAVCDVVVAADDAQFGFTEVTLGLLPAMISPYVVAKIGTSRARELFVTGRRFTAAQAHAFGLAHDVVPASELDHAVNRRISEVLKAAPSAVAATKALLRNITGRSPGDVLAATTAAIARQRVSAEGQDGIRSFLEKRRPGWVRSDDSPA